MTIYEKRLAGVMSHVKKGHNKFFMGNRMTNDMMPVTQNSPSTGETYSGKTRNTTKKEEIVYFKPTLSKKDIKSVMECMVSDEISCGQVALNYEKEVAAAFEVKHAAGVSSHTAAYHLAILACNIEPGENVVLSSVGPLAALDGVAHAGAETILADIDRKGFHPSEETLLEKINEKTAAIILSYPYGAYHDYGTLRDKIREKNTNRAKPILIIEDISYIAGMEVSGSYVGTLGDIAIAGLHEDMLMTIGKGALLLTDSKELYSTIKDRRMHGGNRPYRVRFDYSITDYQAAMGSEQLGQLPAVLERRRLMGRKYIETIQSNRQLSSGFVHPDFDAFGAFPVTSSKPLDYIQRYFKSLQIGARRTLAFGPLHGMMGLDAKEFPNTERFYERSLLIPLYPNLSKVGIERILSSLKGFY